ncbi:MAG: beta-ketoacyl-ACP reductase, partial [Cyanobacteria bacterium PR.023]|nr:beta-ketoacyl-ACP reductase [Cyanobacteria bacterium PR.023]
MGMLADQVAVVTGSGRGIGRAISHALAKEGAKVVISDINEELCKQTAADFEKDGFDAIAVPCNVTDSASVAK